MLLGKLGSLIFNLLILLSMGIRKLLLLNFWHFLKRIKDCKIKFRGTSIGTIRSSMKRRRHSSGSIRTRRRKSTN